MTALRTQRNSAVNASVQQKIDRMEEVKCKQHEAVGFI